MKLRLALATALAAAVIAPASAGATLPQQPDIHDLKLKRTILDDPKVSANVKSIVRLGGFGGISGPIYADLTRDGRDDVLVPIASGGTAGIVAFYVYSYHFGGLRNLLVRNEVYKVGLRVKGGNVVVTYPIYRANDPNCCPSRLERRTLRFNGVRFVRIKTVIVRPG